MLLVGVLVGAFFSALLSGQFQAAWVPAKWASSFGDGPGLRWVVSLIRQRQEDSSTFALLIVYMCLFPEHPPQ